MNNEIPTHDPQTGDINPFYQELTGQPNPLSCGPHLVWWNNLTNEKQYQLNYEFLLILKLNLQPLICILQRNEYNFLDQF